MLLGWNKMHSNLYGLALLAVASLTVAQSGDICSLPIDNINAECGPGTGYRCSDTTCCSKYNYCEFLHTLLVTFKY